MCPLSRYRRSAAAGAAALSRAWALGPKRAGPNILLLGELRLPNGATRLLGRPTAARVLGFSDDDGAVASQMASQAALEGLGGLSISGAGAGAEDGAGASQQQLQQASLGAMLDAIEGGVQVGFQLAAERGPLCDEPLWGLAVRVSVELLPEAGAGFHGTPFNGQARRAALARALSKTH